MRFSLFPFFIFFIAKQQKLEPFTPLKNCFGACCLTIYILLKCLRGRCNHATTTFADLKVYVYEVKGIRLWGNPLKPYLPQVS